MITGLIAVAATYLFHRVFRRSRLRSWLDLDDEPDDRIGRLGQPESDLQPAIDAVGPDPSDPIDPIDRMRAMRRPDDVLSPAGSCGISIVDE